MSPKGRGSNHRRRNRRQALAVGCGDGAHCVGPDTAHLHYQSRLGRPSVMVLPSARRRPWWKRAVDWMKDRLFDLEVTVAPHRAERRLTRWYRNDVARSVVADMRTKTRVRQKR